MLTDKDISVCVLTSHYFDVGIMIPAWLLLEWSDSASIMHHYAVLFEAQSYGIDFESSVTEMDDNSNVVCSNWLSNKWLTCATMFQIL